MKMQYICLQRMRTVAYKYYHVVMSPTHCTLYHSSSAKHLYGPHIRLLFQFHSECQLSQPRYTRCGGLPSSPLAHLSGSYTYTYAAAS